MKNNKWIYLFLFIPALISMSLTSCQKDEDSDNDVNVSWLVGKWNVVDENTNTIVSWTDTTGNVVRPDSVNNLSPRFKSNVWTFYYPRHGMSVRSDSTTIDSVFSTRTQSFQWEDLDTKLVIRNVATFEKQRMDTFDLTKLSTNGFKAVNERVNVVLYDTLLMDVNNDGVKDTLTEITKKTTKTKSLQFESIQ